MDNASQPNVDLNSLPPYLTVKEYAAIMRVTEKAAYAGVRDGTIKSKQAGRRIHIRSEVLPD
jgi:hypothetical protein